jgi:hypothetical protein
MAERQATLVCETMRNALAATGSRLD